MEAQKIHDNLDMIIQQPSSQVHHTNKERLQGLQLLEKIVVLQLKLQRLQKRYNQMKDRGQRILKKNRRKNDEIIKQFKCQDLQCHKIYGSITSLKLHMANKHNMQLNKKTLKQSNQQQQ